MPGTSSAADLGRMYQEQRQEEDPYDVDNWYLPLREVTLETVFIPIEYDVAVLLVKAYTARFLAGEPLDAAEEERLRAVIVGEVGAVVENMPGGAFVRTSMRSPKDAVLAPDAGLADHFATEICAVGRETIEAEAAAAAAAAAASAVDLQRLTHNHVVRAFVRACQRALRVTSGEALLALLLNSERVFQDMRSVVAASDADAAERGGLDGQRVVSVSFVVRAWADLPVEREFRCFWAGGRLRAISQYYHMIRVPDIADHPGVYAAAIEAFLSRHIPVAVPELSEQGLVADVCVLSTAADPAEVVLIELNPLNRATGAALFDWNADRDLLTGRGDGDGDGDGDGGGGGSSADPPAVRVVTKAPTSFDQYPTAEMFVGDAVRIIRQRRDEAARGTWLRVASCLAAVCLIGFAGQR